MTIFNPVWRVRINGVQYQNLTVANLTITSGRTNIYEQPQAGYTNVEILNFDKSNVAIAINQEISIELQDSTATFVPIFGGSIVEVGISVAEVGSTDYVQRITIIALGALARLPKALTDGSFSADYEGNQIATILREVLFNTWQEVPGALTWATYDPTTQWADAENSGLGEIDQPGNYYLAERLGSQINVYSLVAALATSGLGYIYEDAQGRIGYADSTHRTNYLAANGYVDLTANDALASGLSIQSRTGDVRNTITLTYGQNSENQVQSVDPQSVGLYGQLGQIFTTTIEAMADAQDQADFYLSLRAYPRFNLNNVRFELSNPDIDDFDRDALIGVFMGMPVNLADLPLNMNSGDYLGFVEGWTFSARYNEVSISLILSPIAFSLQAMRWNDVPVTETWSTINPTLDWINATIVA